MKKLLEKIFWLEHLVIMALNCKTTKSLLNTTTAVTKSKLNSIRIKNSVHFPLSLITQIDPSLKSKFTVHKYLTRQQEKHYHKSMNKLNSVATSLIMESFDTNILDRLTTITASIFHHTDFFHLSRASSLSFFPRPPAKLFHYIKQYNLQHIATKYDCYVWSHPNESNNVFGIFGFDVCKRRCAIQNIRQFIQQKMEQDMDYIQCDESLKRIYFINSNSNLIYQCNSKFDTNSYRIETGISENGYIWIWSLDKICRQYIKNYIQNEFKTYYISKYIKIEQTKINILWGINGEFDRLFHKHQHHMTYTTVNGKEYKFYSRTWFRYSFDTLVRTQYNSVSKLWICVDTRDYDSVAGAKNSLEYIERLIHQSLTEHCVQWDIGEAYYDQILINLNKNKIDKRLKYDANNGVFSVKHDGSSSGLHEFKTLVFDDIIPKTLIIKDFECFEEANVFQTLMLNELNDEKLKLIQTMNANGVYAVVVYDDKLKDEQYKNKINEIALNLRANKLHKFECKSHRYVNMIIGKNGQHLEDILRYLQFEENKIKSHVLFNGHKNSKSIYIGLDRSDERLEKLFSILNSIAADCFEIKLSPEQWQYFRKNKAWNLKQLDKQFTKCCFQLDDKSADTLIVYAAPNKKESIVKSLVAYES
eukprot:9425_1